MPGKVKSGAAHWRDWSFSTVFLGRKYIRASLASSPDHLQEWKAVMTTSLSSSYPRSAADEPVVNESSSAHKVEPLQAAGITGITGGLTAACRLPIQPLPLSQAASGENLTSNGEKKSAVKASATPGETPPGLASPKLAISKPVGNIPSGSKPRRFSPQLVESTRRRRKSGDSGPTILPHDKTDVSPGTQVTPSPSLKLSVGGELPSVVSTGNNSSAAESRFSFSSLRKKAPRQHSFQVPELPSIQSTGDSEESNESNNPSTSPTPLAASADHVSLQQNIEQRRSVCEGSEGYLLALAAQAVENKLREQAMAAYPNEKIHEPIDHFAVAREDGDGQDKAHVQGHDKAFSMVGDRQRTLAASETILPRASQERFHNHVEAAKEHDHLSGALKIDTEAQWKDVQSLETRKAVSPPLAGQDLQYPFCQSPIQTRFDTGQIYQEREATDLDLTMDHSGLWTPEGGLSRRSSTHGLWMGTCAKSAEDSQSSTTCRMVQTGLLTPAAEQECEPIPLSQCRRQHIESPPLSPPESDDDCKPKACYATPLPLDEEKLFSEEFPDTFITQVYNYISLGYPSMARKFDAELSKITKVSIEGLRTDDDNSSANGYVGVPERLAGGKEEKCPRWCALKKYVREWARQQSRMIGMGNGEKNWGHLEKKGSWAI